MTGKGVVGPLSTVFAAFHLLYASKEESTECKRTDGWRRFWVFVYKRSPRDRSLAQKINLYRQYIYIYKCVYVCVYKVRTE